MLLYFASATCESQNKYVSYIVMSTDVEYIRKQPEHRQQYDGPNDIQTHVHLPWTSDVSTGVSLHKDDIPEIHQNKS